METSFVDARAADDPRWPQLNEAALRRAHGITGEHGSWCLISRWSDDSSLDENWDQHRVHSQRVEMTEGRTGLGSAVPWRTSWSETSRSFAIRNAIVVLTSIG